MSKTDTAAESYVGITMKDIELNYQESEAINADEELQGWIYKRSEIIGYYDFVKNKRKKFNIINARINERLQKHHPLCQICPYEGSIIKSLDAFGIDGVDEEIGLGELMGKDFIITSCMLHYDAGFTFNRMDKFNKFLEIIGRKSS